MRLSPRLEWVLEKRRKVWEDCVLDFRSFEERVSASQEDAVELA
jgi:hypothetical protein